MSESGKVEVVQPFNPAVSFPNDPPQQAPATSTKKHVYSWQRMVAKNWKYPKCPLLEEQILNCVINHMMKYYRAGKINELESYDNIRSPKHNME